MTGGIRENELTVATVLALTDWVRAVVNPGTDPDSAVITLANLLASLLPVSDATAIVKGSSDATKQLRFEVDGFTTSTTRVMTPPNYDGTLATLAGTETLTNKRVTKRSVTVTISATPAINTDNGDVFRIGVSPNFLNAAITSMTTNLSGTPTHGQMMCVEFLDDGTPRAITWGASFRSTDSGTLLATTVANKLSRVLLQRDSADSKWDCVGVTTEA